MYHTHLFDELCGGYRSLLDRDCERLLNIIRFASNFAHIVFYPIRTKISPGSIKKLLFFPPIAVDHPAACTILTDVMLVCAATQILCVTDAIRTGAVYWTYMIYRLLKVLHSDEADNNC